MKDIATAVQHIGKTSSRNDKIALLNKYAELPGFKDVMQFIYDPYIRTGIAATKLKKGSNHELTLTWQDVIEYFTKHQTGSDADVNFAKSFVEQFEKGSDEYKLAEAMVTKSLKIGVTEKTLNKVYGADFIPMIGIMKAEKYNDFKNKVKGPFIVTEKLDGARRILVKEDGAVAMYSRSGIPDEGLIDIEAEAKYLPDNCVFDGELLAIGEFENSIELRQATNAIANSKGVRHGLTFNVFDMIPITDFKKGISVHDAVTRKVMLGALFGDESIECLIPANYKKAIETYKIDFDFKFIKSVGILGTAIEERDVLSFAEPIWRRGFEGVMLNTFKGKYDLTKDRSREILKVKNVEEHTLQVVDVEEGKPGTKNEGRLGSLIVDYKGFRVGVGMGLDDSQRITWWNNPKEIIGKWIEVDCFGESKNKQGGLSLNCAVLKRVVR